MSKKSLEEIIFRSAIYKDAQENFLTKGLQGATETMLNLLGGQLYYPTTSKAAEKREDTDFNKIFTEVVARQLLVDLKSGLMNNDLKNVDITKLTNRKEAK
jgi:hypothetical protein|tara:strand:- start:9298 stop:9600 length:303 start_codon:yes stop_codon:yes gene_type:complete